MFSVSVNADCVDGGALPFEHRETNLASSPTLKFRCKIGAVLVSRLSVVVELLLLVLSATRPLMRPIGRSEIGGMMTATSHLVKLSFESSPLTVVRSADSRANGSVAVLRLSSFLTKAPTESPKLLTSHALNSLSSFS